ncbi:unnamed protein product [Didymodactylos carnosus]|uniref:Tudor domain-containing protein n=1 Tax=Didymodactylos carnosus TaxID=1234261 RepID=A0A814E8N8_9BILA|nr:unnamed protein product [Didymodactylos carnosus]CAF1007089.1 unnamed protein product [Didymodactylos carnosus]CAF3737913.1 unnamed protein product [Didymodactylos carnosus]CAF3776121.1 unnamed protein product [Didymodactylos carnosus]
MSSKSCEISSCKHQASAYCSHCTKDVCELHSDAHVPLVKDKSHLLTDQLNELTDRVNTLSTIQIIEQSLEILDEWQCDSHRLIDNVYTSKRQEIEAVIEGYEQEILQHQSEQNQIVNRLNDELRKLNVKDKRSQHDLEHIERTIIDIETNLSLFQKKIINIQTKKLIIDKECIIVQSANNSIQLENVDRTANAKVYIKMQVIKPGIVWKNAKIITADHPSAFFVQNESDVQQQFRLLTSEMNKYYDKAVQTLQPLKNVSVRDFCVAHYSKDKRWYRARIVLRTSPSTVLVVFVDNGISESISDDRIYQLQEKFVQLPTQVVVCTLSEAFPKDDDTFWPRATADLFSSMVKNKTVEIQFMEKEVDYPLHFVNVYLNKESIKNQSHLKRLMTYASNPVIAKHFGNRLTTMEYILYNLPFTEDDCLIECS